MLILVANTMAENNYEIAGKIISELQGTCNSLEDGIQSVMGEDKNSNNIPIEILEFIDMEIFLCETCGWWYEICERNLNCDDNICDDCDDE